MSIRTILLLAFSCAATLAATQRTTTPPIAPAPVPEWFTAHIEFLTHGSGMFLADNTRYLGEGEAFDAYGLEWRRGLGGHGLAGRLFGVAAGREVATFWEFRSYWDPAGRCVRVLQFGSDGTIGAGTLEPSEAPNAKPGTLVLEQTFTGLDAQSRRSRHVSIDAEQVHSTQSFTRVEDQWVPERAYAWIRQPSKE